MALFSKTNISAGKGKKLIPNQKVPDGFFSPEEQARLLEKGALAEVDEGSVTEPVKASAPAEVPNPAAWAFTDQQLAGKNLEMLNMLAAAHVKKHGIAAVEPFEDEAEARAYLSKDRV